METDTPLYNNGLPYSAAQRFNVEPRLMICYFCEKETAEGLAIDVRRYDPVTNLPGVFTVAVCKECVDTERFSPVEEYARSFEPVHSE